jgi:tryptophan synthase alpha chain
MEHMATGLERIQQLFTRTRLEGRSALMPYFTFGFPDLAISQEIVRAIFSAGADLIELGMPFSDPLADGPTIQHSMQVALERGAKLAGCLAVVRSLRRDEIGQPILLMGYFNPILAYGVERFVTDAAGSGVDGLIVPDLPPEEAVEFGLACEQNGLALVFLLTPTSTPQRIDLILARTYGFVYLVTVTGVTGPRNSLPVDLANFVEKVKAQTKTPLAVGFGISTPGQAREVGGYADGVIIGSALIRAVETAQEPVQAAAGYISAVRAALTDANLPIF